MNQQMGIAVTDPRDVALAEQRERIRNAARRKTWSFFKVTSGSNTVYDIRVWIDMYSPDGTVESNRFNTWVTSLYKLNPDSDDIQGPVLTVDDKTTETIADELDEQIAQRYPDRNITIEVSENGEYGTTIDYNTTRPNLSIKY